MEGVLILLSSAIFVLALTPANANNLVMTSPDIRPGCKDKCSDEVKCVVESGHCLLEYTNSKLVASHPTNLRVNQTKDKNYKYIDLEWTPPDDGSFRDLEAFDVHLGFESHEYEAPGHRGSQCYKVNIVDPQWIGRYSNMSVKFYLRCIRLALKEYMTITISIYSIPVNIQRPKLVSKAIVIRPEQWEPDIHRWADADNNVHICIRNPHPDARFYRLTLYRINTRKTLVFHRVFPAQHVDMKDQTNSRTVLDENHRPHFLIKNLPANHDNHTIVLEGLYVNQSRIPHTKVSTGLFVFNFTSRRIPATSPVSKVVPLTDSDSGVSGQTLLAIIVVLTILVFMCIGLVMWKVKCQEMTSHQWLTCKFLVPTLSNNTKNLPKIVPVYCEENEDFVRAVECHVSLLHRYVNVLPTPQFVGGPRSRSRSTGWCPSPALLFRRNPLLVESSPSSDTKITDVIVYLSPGLGRLLRQDHAHSQGGLSRLDEFCHRTLQSLRHQRQRSSNREEFTIHVVTFDCFQNNELECLPVLSRVFSSSQDENFITSTSTPPANTPAPVSTPTTTTPTTHHHPHSWTPIKLASFIQNSWRLENLDQLLFNLCHAREFPQDLPAGVVGWHESPEAKMVEQYLNRFGTPAITANGGCGGGGGVTFAPGQLGLTTSAGTSSQNSVCLQDQPEVFKRRPSSQGHPDRNSFTDNNSAFIGDQCNSSNITGTSVALLGHPSLESGIVSSSDSGDFYTAAKGTFYTHCPPIPTTPTPTPTPNHPDKFSSTIASDPKSNSVHFTPYKPNPDTIMMNGGVSNRHPSSGNSNRHHPPSREDSQHPHPYPLPQHHPHPHQHQQHYIKPPPPASSMLHLHPDTTPLEDAKSLAESETDNECLGSSLESDSLLNVAEQNNSLGRGKKESENMDKYSLRNFTSSAISPPSSMVHSLKASISDLIAANNATRGWNGGAFT